MSLDVYLYGATTVEVRMCSECDREYNFTNREYLYSDNITHNLGSMARETGIYAHLWHPDEIGIKKAHQLVEPLTKGLLLLKQEVERFEKFNAPNGWGKWEHFVSFVSNYLNACKAYPDADVETSV